MAKAPINDRVAQLELRVAELQAELRAALATPRFDAPRPVRWAITATSGGTYPAANTNPNTYPIILLDGTFTQSPGAQSVTWSQRQSQARAVVNNLASGLEAYIPQGTYIPVWPDRGRWWTDWHGQNTYHFTAAAGASSGGTFSVTLPDGRSVSATAQGDIASGDLGIVWKSGPGSSNWYAMVGGSGEGSGGGGGGDQQAIVMVYGSAKDEGTCLYPGKVRAISGSPTGFCSDPFTSTADCWLLLLEERDGSFASPQSELLVGDHFLGRRVFTLAGVPVYAIRDHRSIWAVVYTGSPVGAGLTGNIAIPGLGTVTFTNWSPSVVIDEADEITVYRDSYDGTYKAIKTQAADAGDGMRLFIATLDAVLHSGDVTGTIASMYAMDDGEDFSFVTEAQNLFGLAGDIGRWVLLAPDSSGESTSYIIIQVEHVQKSQLLTNVHVDSMGTPTELQQDYWTTITVMDTGASETLDETIATINEECPDP